MRGGQFRVHSAPLSQRGVEGISVEIPDTLLRTVTPPARITEQDLGWDFTPTHEDVRPGSVSNPSLLTSGGSATAAASDTTAAFTPTASSLLVVAWGAGHGTTMPGFTFSNTHAVSGAWAAVEKTQSPSTEFFRHSQARCQMGASPGSGTVTNTYDTVQPSRKSWIIAEVTGHHTTTPLSESNTGGADTGTSLSVVLGGIAAGNLAIGSISLYGNAAGGVTPGTNETELADVASGGTGQMNTQMEYGTDITVNWSWSNSNQNAGVAVEYAQAAGGGAVTRTQSVIIA